MHNTLISILIAVLMLSACSTTPTRDGGLQQAPPREIADSLMLPADVTLGPVVAGLAQGAVPQGMTQLAAPERLLTSHYADDGGPSRLVVTDWQSGTATATFQLVGPEGQSHNGHVGESPPTLPVSGLLPMPIFIVASSISSWALRPGGISS